MKIPSINRQDRRGAQSAFTLVEVVVAVGLAGIMIASALAGFSSGFASVQIDRENSRAAQILLEKTELVRLYNWDQITGNDTNVYIPTNFSAPFYPDASNGGLTFSGTAIIANVSGTESYTNDLRQITLTVSWTSGRVQRSRSMTTYISKYGLQNYIY